jgi:hypothetical protein
MEQLLTGVAIALISGLLGFYLGVTRDKIKLKNEKTQEFKKLIAEEIIALKMGMRKDFSSFEQILREQEISAIEYANSINFFRKRKFDRLWFQYKSVTSEKEAILPAGAIGYKNHQKALKILESIMRIT